MSQNQFQVSDELQINLPRDDVWQQLNDPEVLSQCIRGCSRMEKPSATQYDAIIEARIGQLAREFKVALTVEDAQAPQHYRLCSKMRAGWFGQATGVADVTLLEQGELTVLQYQATIGLSGLLAKATSLIAPLAQNRVREFFQRFVDCTGATASSQAGKGESARLQADSTN